MPKEGDIVMMGDGNDVRYLEMHVLLPQEINDMEVLNGVQCESEEIDGGEQPGQPEVEQRQVRD